MSKVLYFEGAGMNIDEEGSNVGNYRIRTAFLNSEGRKIYLELGGHKFNDKKKSGWASNIDTTFYITGDWEDENINRIKVKNDMEGYSIEEITKWVNKTFNMNFETIEVLPDLSGYRVHGEKRSYNMMENYIYNPELIYKREEVQEYFYDLEKSEGKKYPNFSIWVDEPDSNILHLLRHFNGYNKHWIIRTDVENWKDSIEETKLNKYGC